MSQRIAICATLAVTCLLAGCAQPAKRGPSEDELSAVRKLQRIALMAPEVEYVEVAFTGENERLPAVEKRLAATIEEELNEILVSRGYTVRKPAELPQDQRQGLEFDYGQLRSALQAAAATVATPVENKEEDPGGDPIKLPRLSVGQSAGPVATRLDVDGILVVRYRGFRKTGGQKAAEVTGDIVIGALTGVLRFRASEGGELTLVLVDGATGNVLWAARGRNARYQGANNRRSRLPLTATDAATIAMRSWPQRPGTESAPLTEPPPLEEAASSERPQGPVQQPASTDPGKK